MSSVTSDQSKYKLLWEKELTINYNCWKANTVLDSSTSHSFHILIGQLKRKSSESYQKDVKKSLKRQRYDAQHFNSNISSYVIPRA